MGTFSVKKRPTVLCSFVLLPVGDLLELFVLHLHLILKPSGEQPLSLRSSFQKESSDTVI